MSADRILITGGAGFIGTNLARKMLKLGLKVRVIDNFNPQIHRLPKLDADISEDVELLVGDVRDRQMMRKALDQVDCIVHLAAETGTGQSMYEIEKYFGVNVQGTACMLDILQNDNCAPNLRTITVASSRAVYGEGAYICETHGLVFPGQRSYAEMLNGEFDPVCPICGNMVQLTLTPESAPFQPMSVYGLTKQVQEQAVLMFARNRGVNGFGLRYQNVYGPGQSLINPYTGILAVFSNLARQNQNIEIYEDGLESRDFVYIDDVVDATVSSCFYKNEYVGALNVGCGRSISVMKVAQEVVNFFDSQSTIKVSGSFRMGDIRHNIADVNLIQNLLNIVPKVTFERGIASFLNWASSQPAAENSAYLRSINEISEKGLMHRDSSL